MNAVLIIDKPAGMTSHDVVHRLRRILREPSVGHLGTLDPMATGVLPLVTGNLTRLAQFYTGSEKTYEGAIRFGFATDTYDAEGAATTEPKNVSLKIEQVEAVAARFRGVIEQTPPPFSAKKIKGVPAYKLARQKKEVSLQPVQVEIKEFEILSVASDRVHFRARVASGTYMRSVAHDMGRELACGAHLESLRRTSVAEFTLADAHTLEAIQESFNAHAINERDHSKPATSIEEEFSNRCHSERAQSAGEEPAVTLTLAEPLEPLCIHPRKLLPQFPCVMADDAAAAFIRSGRTVNLPEFSRAPQVKVFSGQSNLIAIATRVAGTLFHPKIVLMA